MAGRRWWMECRSGSCCVPSDRRSSDGFDRVAGLEQIKEVMNEVLDLDGGIIVERGHWDEGAVVVVSVVGHGDSDQRREVVRRGRPQRRCATRFSPSGQIPQLTQRHRQHREVSGFRITQFRQQTL